MTGPQADANQRNRIVADGLKGSRVRDVSIVFADRSLCSSIP